MLAIRTILHPTDFSAPSMCALHLATALARDYGAHLILLHVRPTPVMIYGYGEGILPPNTEELQNELDQIHVPDENLWVSRRLEDGDPVTEILAVAGETHADLIVMGTHGRRGISRFLMGSVSEQVERRASCPVLMIRTPFHEGEADSAAVRAGAESPGYNV